MSVRNLTKDLQEKAEKELNEIPDRIKSDIATIKEWIRKEPHLNARTDDQWILAFLRRCNFSLERTKERIDMYYSMRTLVPTFFSNRDPFLPEIQELLKTGGMFALPTPEGSGDPQIVFVRWSVLQPDIVTFTTFLKVYFMIIDILLLESDSCTICGEEIFGDFTDFSSKYVPQFTPIILNQFVMLTEKAYPTRIKGFHWVNSPANIERAFAIMKGFMSTKLQNRTILYNKRDADQVYSKVSKSRLPKEYGGDCGSIDEIAAFWKSKIESYRDWFLEDSKYIDELFGVEGTFRKSEID